MVETFADHRAINVINCTSHFIDQSGHHGGSFLYCRNFSLEQLARSDLLFSTSGTFQKVAENVNVHTML